MHTLHVIGLKPSPGMRVGAACLLSLVALAGCASNGDGAGNSQAYEGHRWRVTHVEQIKPEHRVMDVATSERVWIRFDGHGHMTGNDVVQRFTLRYWPTSYGFRANHHDPACCGWYASRHDANVDEGLCAVVGSGRIAVTQLSDGSLQLASDLPQDAQRRGSYVLTVVRD
jgi:hypothetical protein